MTNHFQPTASGATASRPSTPQSALRTPRSDSAFTLIEILVVVSIIAILSALILATAGYAMSKARRSRVETELATLVSAIQSYKAAKGFYPQDDPANYSLSPLYYELTGTTITLSGGVPSSYFSATSGDTLNVATDFTNIFNGAVSGFVNASPDASQVQNFFGATGKSARTGHILTNNGATTTLFTVFGVPVSGPVQFRTTNGAPISPWFYNSSNPTNNANGGYDLWMDVFYSGRTNRISNWSQNPQPQ